MASKDKSKRLANRAAIKTQAAWFAVREAIEETADPTRLSVLNHCRDALANCRDRLIELQTG